MDSLVAAAGRALAAGDALGALKRVALRSDAPALALRGIAMAQLGEHARARELLRLAARGFGTHEALARARCIVADAEVALAMRELGGSARTLATTADTLEARGDRANALHARLIAVRRLLLLGRVDEAAASLARLNATGAPPALSVIAALASAEVALRALRSDDARSALERAQAAAQRARVPALTAEVDETHAALARPAARLRRQDRETPLRLDEVEALVASRTLVVDACRRGLRLGGAWLPLARRPVLFALARGLAEAWPGDADRNELIATAFRTRRPDETHRVRLRVEIGRLRRLAAPLARITATERGFALAPHDGRDPAGPPHDARAFKAMPHDRRASQATPHGAHEVAVLLPPIDGDEASLLALLADGSAWSTSALALALGQSQRTVQRALVDLEARGRVRSIGRGRVQRWLSPPLAGFTTILLLPAALPVT